MGAPLRKSGHCKALPATLGLDDLALAQAVRQNVDLPCIEPWPAWSRASRTRRLPAAANMGASPPRIDRYGPDAQATRCLYRGARCSRWRLTGVPIFFADSVQRGELLMLNDLGKGCAMVKDLCFFQRRDLQVLSA